ncbi:MAG: hypothetical protein HC888_08095 [Candidatus Competibacteraceae bacterium]|nr:hypothetical protein [Candidatus Competibacteraceae bacterium]
MVDDALPPRLIAPAYPFAVAAAVLTLAALVVSLISLVSNFRRRAGVDKTSSMPAGVEGKQAS